MEDFRTMKQTMYWILDKGRNWVRPHINCNRVS